MLVDSLEQNIASLLTEDKLLSSQQLDFIRSEGELKCCTFYGSMRFYAHAQNL